MRLISRNFVAVFATACLLAPAGLAQSRIVSKGHGVPALPQTSVGEVVTLFARGVDAQSARADSLPLPTILGGVTVAARDPLGGLFDGDLPIFSVEPVQCDGSQNAPCRLTAITVQMPSDIQRCLPVGAPIFDPCISRLMLSVQADGAATEESEYTLAASTIHVLASCDMTLRGFYNLPNELLGSCVALVMKPDGTLVSGVNPARPGETVTLFALGLGFRNAQVPMGHASPPRISYDPSLFYVAFEPRVSGIPQPPSEHPWFDQVSPDYVGLVPGAVGLYQVNLRLPQEFAAPLSVCAGFSSAVNVTITFGSTDSRDAAVICVQE